MTCTQCATEILWHLFVAFVAAIGNVAADENIVATLRVTTSNERGSATRAGATFAFRVNGIWLPDEELCAEAHVEEAVVVSRELAAWPSHLRLRVGRHEPPLIDAWGISKISLEMAGTGHLCTILAPCVRDQCSFATESPYWIHHNQIYKNFSVPGQECSTIARVNRSPNSTNTEPSVRATRLCRRTFNSFASKVACAGVGSNAETFLMHSAHDVHERFGHKPPHPANAEHFVCVRHREGDWQYSARSEWWPFTLQHGDVLVAAVNLGSGASTSFNGTSRVHHRAVVGYSSGDLHVELCAWHEQGDVVSFCVSGTFFVAVCSDANGGDLPPTWETGPWGLCSATCGRGNRSRSVLCSASSEVSCYASGPRPLEQMMCIGSGPCPEKSVDNGPCRLANGMDCSVQWWLISGLASCILVGCSLTCGLRLACFRKKKCHTKTYHTSKVAATPCRQQQSHRVHAECVHADCVHAECVHAECVHAETAFPQCFEVADAKDLQEFSGGEHVTNQLAPVIPHHLDQQVMRPLQHSSQNSKESRSEVQRCPQRKVDTATMLEGAWRYGLEGAMFVVSRGGPGPLDISTGNLLRFDEQLTTGAKLSGFLRPSGDWTQCRNLLFSNPDGISRPAGAVRLRFVEELDSLLVNFMPTGTTTWGPDVFAAKFDTPSHDGVAEAQPPWQLCIECSSTQVSCSGIYSLVPDEQVHGMPLWMRSDGDRWLYCGSDGKWYVGGKLSQQKGFSCASGFLHCSEVCPGALPHYLNGWYWGDGKEWHKDETICIRELPQLPRQCAEPEKQVRPELSKAANSNTKDLTEDGPGQYVITHDNAAITADVAVCSPITARLARGTQVCVVEVHQTRANGRLRARISHPSGWISLAHLLDGYRWAYRQDDVLRHGGLSAVTEGRLKRCRSSVSTEAGSEVAGANGSSGSPTSCSDGVSESSSAARSPQLSTPSDSGSSALAWHPMLTPSTPPQALRVTSPNGQEECSGIYVLVATEKPNGQPVWEQSCRGGHWLYSGKTGKWCIGGQDVRESNFDTAAGWLYQQRHHKGRMPHNVEGRWRRWDGSNFQEDDAIGIAVATPSMLPPSSCSRGTSSIPSRGDSCISSHSDGSTSQQSLPQPSVPLAYSPLSSDYCGDSSSSDGSHGSSLPPPPPAPPTQSPAAESELLDLRGSRLEDRHRRVLEAAHVGSQLRVCI